MDRAEQAWHRMSHFVHRSCIQIHDGGNIVKVIITKASIEREIDLGPRVIDVGEALVKAIEVVIQHHTKAEALRIMMTSNFTLSES